MLAYLVLDSMRTGRPIPLYEGGELLRDWTYVGDIVDGVVRAVDRRLGYEVINIGRGEPVLVKDFIRNLQDHSGKAANLVPAPMNAADVELTFANIDKARRLLDYTPRTSVAEGTRHFYDWFTRHVGAV